MKRKIYIIQELVKGNINICKNDDQLYKKIIEYKREEIPFTVNYMTLDTKPENNCVKITRSKVLQE